LPDAAQLVDGYGRFAGIDADAQMTTNDDGCGRSRFILGN